MGAPVTVVIWKGAGTRQADALEIESGIYCAKYEGTEPVMGGAGGRVGYAIGGGGSASSLHACVLLKNAVVTVQRELR